MHRAFSTIGFVLWIVFVCGTAAHVTGCASGDNPEGSSSSHWVRCSDRDDCSEFEEASCAEDGYCVDESGERIRVRDNSGIGTVNDQKDDDDDITVAPELVACQPLARWQRAVEPSDPIVVARDQSGTVYAVTPFDGDYLAWRSRGDALEPLRVLGSGSDGGELSLSVEDGEGGFALLVSSDGDGSSVTLFPGLVEARDLDPSMGERIDVIDGSALSAFEPARLDVAARVEAHVSELEMPDQELIEVLVLSPEWASGYEDFRLFYGTNNLLSERAIGGVTRERGDDTTLIDFELPSGEATTLTFSPGGGASLLEGGERVILWQRSSTELGLARLDFRCLEPVARRFEATGAPFEPPATQCDTPRVPMGGCLSSTSEMVASSASEALLDTTAVVVEIIEGPLPDGTDFTNGEPQNCLFGVENIRFGDIYPSETDPNLMEELYSLHIEHGGGDSWIVLRAPNLDLPLEVGATIQLRQKSLFDFGGATISSIEIRDESGGLIFWLGQAYILEELDLPVELTLETGEELCSLSDTCALDYGYYTIDAAVDGDTATVRQGESIELGAYRFTSSAYQLQTGAFACTDSTAYFIRMALWRR